MSKIDFASLTLKKSPNQYLVLPPGMAAAAKPHRQSPVFRVDPSILYRAWQAVVLASPRVTVVQDQGPEGQFEVVQRSLLFRFPDTITSAVYPVEGGAALAVYSRSTYGHGDMGVNKRRIDGWLANLEAHLEDAVTPA